MRVTGVVVVARGCKVGRGAARAGKKFKKTRVRVRVRVRVGVGVGVGGGSEFARATLNSFETLSDNLVI